MVPCVALVGALIGAPLAKMGRRTAMIIVDIGGIIGVIICLVSINQVSLYMFYAGRALCGLVTGCNSALTPLYIKEISPISMSG